MIYHLATALFKTYPFLRLFRYISVRSICAVTFSFILTLIIGSKFLKIAHKHLAAGIREYTPKNHEAKGATPTMGGLFIIPAIILSTLLWNNFASPYVWTLLFVLIGFGAIGFSDDWSKIKNQAGISAKVKFTFQLLVAGITLALWLFYCNPPQTICIPFFKNFCPHLGWILIPWGIFILVGCSNAVNLTDGLDGLVSGPLIFSFGTFAIIAYLAGHTLLSGYLAIPSAPTSELTICCASIIGALMGFLWYNAHPAQVFMGDIGSLSLGAALAFIALATRQELLLPITGGIFVLETVSVIIQVLSFKLFKKRVFAMAPIHHHFELKGWNEAKITIRFWIISILLSLGTLLTIKIR
ncbi:phospho-N-acetylmuramoyl-pentapeptide-transferase [Candidatus Babeliales bacterium]|nr:phospho-N-acetylmuramoyl-pentapeptide-transferase [Candidatus Babeliales bacterium]